MKSILTSTAVALVLGLSIGGGLGGFASPAQAQCVRVAALDLNGDNWIDGDERRMARNAGFHSFDTNGDLYVSAEEMNMCLSGGNAAFRWLSGANPNFASAGTTNTMPGDMQAPSEGYAPAPTGMAYGAQERGAAYDTPTPVARESALRYLQSKVDADPRFQQQYGTSSSGIGGIEPASGPVTAPDPLGEFSMMDLNGDGVISAAEYQAHRARLGTY